jgi:hypothetical protein
MTLSLTCAKANSMRMGGGRSRGVLAFPKRYAARGKNDSGTFIAARVFLIIAANSSFCIYGKFSIML